MLIADTLAREIVDPVFGVPEAYFAPDAVLATLAYAAQIYCDFSGYTDIAIGLALLMGFIFPQNFNNPYRATGFRDFWRRWHMTLSRFLRDYLYIPLGGSRGSRLFTYRNLMITMVLGGLWHGAAWTFVLWGAFHGAMLVTEHALDGRVGRRTPAWLRWLGTFAAVCFGWILFRSPDLDLFWTFLGRIVDPGPATLWTLPVARRGRGGDRAAAPAAPPARAPAAADRGVSPAGAGGRPGRRDPHRRRHGAQPGRAPLHLFSVLSWE